MGQAILDGPLISGMLVEGPGLEKMDLNFGVGIQGGLALGFLSRERAKELRLEWC